MASNLKVIIENAQVKFKIPSGTRMLVRRSCLAALSFAGFRGSTEIHVYFTDNDGIRELNRELFGSSDVEELLFRKSDLNGVLGEIYLSLEAAEQLASRHFRSFQREVVYLTVHGMLGIMDFTDPEEAEEQEQAIMYELGFPLSTAYSLAQ